MASTIDCPSCNRKLRVPDELVGRPVRCPTCGTTFTAMIGVPEAEEIASAPAPLPHGDEAPAPTGGDEFEDRPLSRRRRSPVAAHRGALILTLGIVSIVVCCCHFLGPVAWIMGNNDLREMREGRMDRDGEGTTQAGRICGIIGTVMMILACLSCGLLTVGNLAAAAITNWRGGP